MRQELADKRILPDEMLQKIFKFAREDEYFRQHALFDEFPKTLEEFRSWLTSPGLMVSEFLFPSKNRFHDTPGPRSGNILVAPTKLPFVDGTDLEGWHAEG
eukprot:GSA25T00021728001.1